MLAIEDSVQLSLLFSCYYKGQLGSNSGYVCHCLERLTPPFFCNIC